jgi:hypothetical protein
VVTISEVIESFRILGDSVYIVIGFTEEAVKYEYFLLDLFWEKEGAVKVSFTALFKEGVDGAMGHIIHLCYWSLHLP